MDPSKEITFEAAGRSYVLAFGNRAFRMAEKELGKPFPQFDLTALSESTVMVWAGLQRHHKGLSLEDVDDIIDDVGYARISDLVAAAITAALPAAGDDQGEALAAGTGTSTSGRA